MTTTPSGRLSRAQSLSSTGTWEPNTKTMAEHKAASCGDMSESDSAYASMIESESEVLDTTSSLSSSRISLGSLNTSAENLPQQKAARLVRKRSLINETIEETATETESTDADTGKVVLTFLEEVIAVSLCVFCVSCAVPFHVVYFSWTALGLELSLALALLYAFHIVTDRTPANGHGRKNEWFMNSTPWHCLCKYFPIQLDSELGPLPEDSALSPYSKDQYVFAFHPHGVVPVHVVSGALSPAAGIKRYFPKANMRLITVAFNFFLPVWRELYLAFGLVTSSMESARNVLSVGNSLAVLPGGIAEMCMSRPDREQLYLSRRRGFIRLAMQHGRDIVPVYCFGGNRIIGMVTTGIWGALNDWLQTKYQLIIPIPYGRWNLIVPRKHPITFVFGEPLVVPNCDNPTPEMVQHYHQLYMKRLERLYYQFRDQYGDPSCDLEIM
eukprot:Clim_evm5s210 gene=Clim_evmTU5s210